MTQAGLISIVGGESTGKSVLAAALGSRLPAVVVPEFLRTWVERHDGRVPGPVQQAQVMAAHRESELSALASASRKKNSGHSGWPWVVSDSGPLMTAVYRIQYYGDAALLPQALEWTMRSEQVLWCQDDFPWQPDPQRDGSHARAESQRILATIFAEHPALPVLAVHGPLDQRIETVLRAVADPSRDEPTG